MLTYDVFFLEYCPYQSGMRLLTRCCCIFTQQKVANFDFIEEDNKHQQTSYCSKKCGSDLVGASEPSAHHDDHGPAVQYEKPPVVNRGLRSSMAMVTYAKISHQAK